MAENLRAHVMIKGKVQGVCFRMETKRAAQNFGVNGWVRNNPDGSVEGVYEGNAESVNKLLNWSKKGPAIARVDDLKIDMQEFKNDFNSFEITY